MSIFGVSRASQNFGKDGYLHKIKISRKRCADLLLEIDIRCKDERATRVSSIPIFQPKFLFRWFKFTLKPPYSGVHEHSLSAIWDTSHWNFFVKFGLRTA